MFSVSLLYSTKDFLCLITEAGLTPGAFKESFTKFKYSSTDQILDVSFKCGWARLDEHGKILLSIRGTNISALDYKNALLLQLEDLILNYNPQWASLLPKGRVSAKNYLPEDAKQCFKECGLFDELNTEIIAFWDRLSLAYRNYANQKKLEIGRLGEQLTYEYETLRTGKPPAWQAVESNSAGYDILSIVDKTNAQKLSIEVKATSLNIQYAAFHITKNEWDVATESLNYIFHLWHIPSKSLKIVNKNIISDHIPQNIGHGEWESVEIPYRIFFS